MTTSKHSTGQNSGEQLTLLLGDFLVNHSHWQAKEPLTSRSGKKCFESWLRFGHPSSLQKMFTEYLLVKKEWRSQRCTMTWKVKVIPRCRRLLFQLVPRARRTEGTGFGLLPSPTAAVVHTENLEKLEARRERIKAKKINGNGFGPSLNELAQRGLLPTPSATDHKGGVKKETA